ncbi:MAG: hypothetical protein UW05_C0002G0002 [Candidatus Giovannonibacteria bacterium GW2011_GWC2_43_8]|nr:MAG: hypothetical protein UW05_C0002G0002 [Candidatus Giovannonibacteria bacterium GW2011_GWC2_43_8]
MPGIEPGSEKIMIYGLQAYSLDCSREKFFQVILLIEFFSLITPATL